MTPTARILSSANALFSAADATGRNIVARRLNALDKLRLLKAAGPILSDNQAWLGVAMLAASVTEIDGTPVPMPMTEHQIEGLVGRLGDAGLDAVAAMLATGEPDAEAPVGNLAGTPT